MPIVKMPDGTQVQFPDDMPDTQIRSMIASKFPEVAKQADQANAANDAQSQRDEYYSSGIYAGSLNPLGSIARSIDAFASGAQRAPLMGFDDEAVAGLRSLAGADYSQAQVEEQAKKQAMRNEAPVASTLGELAGGLATGGTLAANGITLAGRNIPLVGRTGGAMLEGAAYGAANGAGEANPGDRTTGAAVGAALGAGIGGAASNFGDMLASRAARSASSASAPTVDDLAAVSNNLYRQADAAGVTIAPSSMDNTINAMMAVAGRTNRDLRPATAGMVDDLMALKGKPLTLGEFDELRQSLSQAMSGAKPQDVRGLELMKKQLDGFADRIGTSDLTSGTPQAFDMLKEARGLWAKKSKAQTIEQLLDFSDVDSAKYSQSGMANAVRLRSQQLYKAIQTGKQKGFSAEETDLVRKLAKGEMTPPVMNLLAKFAPRGVVSFGSGVGVGSVLGGPVGAMLPGMVGYGAAALADRAAIQGANALRDAAASGTAPVLKAITNKTVPFIGGTAGSSSSLAARGR